MSWAQTFADNAFLVFSISCGSAALAVMMYTILNFKRRTRTAGPTSNGRDASGSKKKNWRRSVLDRVTLLNKNFIQCPECFKIDFVNIRFCSRCGVRLIPGAELSRDDLHDIQTQYIASDRSTRLVGISMKPDARTRIGVIIGIQDGESPTDAPSDDA